MLNGNIQRECGGCQSSMACRPGKPGFSKLQRVPSGGWHEPSSGWNEPSGGWHEPSEGWHEPSGGWHEPDGGWHEPTGSWHEPPQKEDQSRDGEAHRRWDGRTSWEWDELDDEAGTSEWDGPNFQEQTDAREWNEPGEHSRSWTNSGSGSTHRSSGHGGDGREDEEVLRCLKRLEQEAHMHAVASWQHVHCFAGCVGHVVSAPVNRIWYPR